MTHLFKPLLLSLGLVAATFNLNACAAKPGSASSLKIRNGALVDPQSTGPEVVSTVGLKGQSGDEAYSCSAAIIGRDLLVTAGHCIPSANGTLAAYFGPDMRDAAPEEFIPVAATDLNPNYSSESVEGLPLDDVAVLRLATPIPAGYKAAKIVPSDQDLSVGGSVRLAGFGITEAGDDSGLLRYVDTTYVGPDAAGRLQISDTQRRGACSGDSGGPLFALVHGRWFLAGVLSGGPVPCRGVNVYTSLASHRAFLGEAEARLAGE